MDSSSRAAALAAGLAGPADERAWLTAILRPAGLLNHAAARRLGAALGCLAAASDMAIVDLTAVTVSDPRTFAATLRGPAAEFEQAGRCLLVIGASPRLTAELDRAAVPLAALAGDALPVPLAA